MLTCIFTRGGVLVACLELVGLFKALRIVVNGTRPFVAIGKATSLEVFMTVKDLDMAVKLLQADYIP